MSTKVVIVGGGFAGLNAAKILGKCRGVDVTLIDRRNHHLFQPLLYQVATAGLSPADIAAPIRSILNRNRNTTVLQGEVQSVELSSSTVHCDFDSFDYDYLVLACGSTHSYFGNDQWQSNAPGLKTIEEATEIRRRILLAFENAERCEDEAKRREYLTFVIVGGGPTGVELAGAIGEMSRFTLAKDFHRIDAKLTRIFLMEAGPRILPAFPKDLSDRATRDLEKLGVQVWASSPVSQIDEQGVTVGDERIQSATVIWAAGVQSEKVSLLGGQVESDRAGRIKVEQDLSVPAFPNVFVAGDQAQFVDKDGESLPGLSPVAIQQGRFIARAIRDEIKGKERRQFHYRDRGIMATIGRNKAVVHSGKLNLSGRLAWMSWLLVHIYFLTGFKNRLLVVMQWAWSYITYRRGARLIVGDEIDGESTEASSAQAAEGSR